MAKDLCDCTISKRVDSGYPTNEDTRAVVQRKETVMDTIRMRKLQLFGHICRTPDDRLLKTVLFGMVEVERRQGRRSRRLMTF